VSNGTWERLVYGVGAATIAVFGIFFIYCCVEGLSYRRSHYKSARWQSVALPASDGWVNLRLRWPDNGLSQDLSQLGVVEAWALNPGGSVRQIERIEPYRGTGFDGYGQHELWAGWEAKDDGTYEVRWYSDPGGSGAFAEICRGTFSVRDGVIDTS
jgi:hypothetical protein